MEAHRPAHRRHRARLQQPADGHHRQSRDAAAARCSAGGERDSSRRSIDAMRRSARARGDADAAAARLLAPAAARSPSRSTPTGSSPACRSCCAARLGERSRSRPCWPAVCGGLRSIPTSSRARILNLAVNARDAMPRRRQAHDRDRQRLSRREPMPPRSREVAPGQYVVIAVTDTGIGMTKEVLARAFEPFFTTKESARAPGSACRRSTASSSSRAATSRSTARPARARP